MRKRQYPIDIKSWNRPRFRRRMKNADRAKAPPSIGLRRGSYVPPRRTDAGHMGKIR